MTGVFQQVRRLLFKRRTRNKIESEIWEAEMAMEYNGARINNIAKMVEDKEAERVALSEELLALANEHTVEAREKKKELEGKVAEKNAEATGLKRLANAIIQDVKGLEGKAAVASDRLEFLLRGGVKIK